MNQRPLILQGDALAMLRTLPDASVQACVTSPPYYALRDYGMTGQIGLEDTPDAYVQRLVEVFSEVRRVLRDDGTLWVNIGDTYAGTGKSGGGAQGQRWEAYGADTEGPRGGKWAPPPRGLKQKDLIGIPWMLAFALRADGWYLRQDIIWAKPNPMPESVTDRCTKAHEYVFLLSKSSRYYMSPEGLAESATCTRMRGPALHADTKSTNGNSGLSRREPSDTRNRRSVWSIATKPFADAHFAVMPLELAETCILASTRPGDTVLDPFMGAFTTAYAALLHGRRAMGTELNPEYIAIGERRIAPFFDHPLFAGLEVTA